MCIICINILNFNDPFFFFQFEAAAKEMADEVTRPRPEGEETVQDIQIMLKSEANPVAIRHLTVSFPGEIDFFPAVWIILLMMFNIKASTICSGGKLWTVVV